MNYRITEAQALELQAINNNTGTFVITTGNLELDDSFLSNPAFQAQIDWFNLNKDTFIKIIEPVTPMYLRIILSQMGLMEAVNIELAKPENATANIAFEYALEFKRTNPLIIQMQANLNLTDAQVDALFIACNELKHQIDG